MENHIQVKAVRTNNLKNIDVSIPLGLITAVVGVSGAGKSSLAIHTLYAEGYIRYIESISPYIRQFLDLVEKPDVDSIENLPPAIAFRQKKPVKNPRSIVATASDIYDYLRILYAKIAEFHCPTCGMKIKKFSIDEIMTEIMELEKGTIRICFEYRGDIAFLINRGYYHHVVEGQKREINPQVRNQKIWVLIDEIENTMGNKSRIFEALDQSISLGGKSAIVFRKQKPLSFPVSLFCPRCEIEYATPDENLFSFNSPKGACPDCRGFGDVMEIDRDLVLDRALSLREGAIVPLNTPANRPYRDYVLKAARKRRIDLARPVAELPEKDIRFLMYGDGKFEGIKGLFDWIKTKTYKVQARVFLSRFTSYIPCPQCRGSRFNALVRAFTINGRSIADFLSLTVGEAFEFMKSLDHRHYRNRISDDVFKEIAAKLKYLMDSRLHYIQLNRQMFTLSRGEFQRINLAFIMGSTLSDSLLIIDQPSADLHPRDFEKLRYFLDNLKKNGNTIVMIEHNREVIRQADHVIELGPLSGSAGGAIIFEGSRELFFRSRRTLTQNYLHQPPAPIGGKSKFKEWITFGKASAHNLKNFDFRLPRYALTVITGLSGAGKTTLLHDEIYLKHKKIAGIEEITYIDPGIIRMRSNTNIASFFDILAPIREFYAHLKQSQLLGFLPGHFSFNSPLGRCSECKGKGYNEIEMQFLPSVKIACRTCGGSGFQPDVLKVTHRDQSIADVLKLSIDEFLVFMGNDIPQVVPILENLRENKLGYLKIGQAINSLSTGELQKIKLNKYLNLGVSDHLFLIDEPSFGLHPHDLEIVLNMIRRLLETGNTVVAIEHNLRLIAGADYIIELGPEGGEEGGFLMYQGPISSILTQKDSITGHYLKKYIKTT